MNQCLKRWFSIVTAVIGLGLILPNLQAGEHRRHESHVHGRAHLNVAQDGSRLYIELTSPTANIVGFEHRPRTREQKAAVKTAVDTLKAGEDLFDLSRDAGCGLVKSGVHTDIISDSGHESESAASHEHDDVSGDAGQDSEKKDQEPPQNEDKHKRHSEFKAEYHFICHNPAKLGHLDVMLFRNFAGIEHIDVQLLTATRQTALELTAKKNKIDF